MKHEFPISGKKIGYDSKCCKTCKPKDYTAEHWNKIHKSVSKSMRGKMPKNIMSSGQFMNIKRGYFDINGKTMFFRSSWEANYALYLDWLILRKEILSWGYEADVFVFDKIKRGTQTYRPDFKIFNLNGEVEYHEIKGWMTAKSKTQISRMKKYYPDVKFVLIDKKAYNELSNKIGWMLNFFSSKSEKQVLNVSVL